MSSSALASGVEPSSQNVWHRYMPRVPLPRNPSRSRRRLAALRLWGLRLSCLTAASKSAALSNAVRTRPFASLSA